MITSSEIRESFLKFFEDRGHTRVPSASVVPADDPTLLFTNAGMNQFKDIILGTGERPYKRAVDTQKCIRVSGKHNDLEEVGKDTYHHTFFEMLGNWSFGDYYKKEAIVFGWELLTERWNLEKDKLWATIYSKDDEADACWRKYTDVRTEHILRFDEKYNFWEMGEIGPCGPCSEIHIDLGTQFCQHKNGGGHQCKVNSGCGRFIELWNLVFIQYNREKGGGLSALAKKSIDTGMGFERVTAILQKVYSNFETDLFSDIIQQIESLSGQPYRSHQTGMPHRVIADHLRTLSFAIADGVMPSNEGRGYVLRRLLRRAARYGRMLGQNDPFLYHLLDPLVKVMGSVFPEISLKKSFIQATLRLEEEKFNQTLDQGLGLFEKIKQKLRAQQSRMIPGETVFEFYDTYGFPPDLVQLLAEEQGFQIDIEGFQQRMGEQKERARKTAKFYDINQFDTAEWKKVSSGEDSFFTGYESCEEEVRIIRYLEKEGTVYLVLDRTPFYAAGGGQVGDSGTLEHSQGKIEILDTLKHPRGTIHVGRCATGQIPWEKIFQARVDSTRRRATEKNHSATHLLQAALRSILGTHVQQSGSLVESSRLRFDFTHLQSLTESEIQTVEKLINEKIRGNLPVLWNYQALAQAKAEGAMALFGEKYGEKVRVVQIGNFSKELCGGTHVQTTGEIGLFVIFAETAISAGIRRIEALTGEGAFRYLDSLRQSALNAARSLKTVPDNLSEKIVQLQEQLKNLEKQNRQLFREKVAGEADQLLKDALIINGCHVIRKKVLARDVKDLLDMADILRQRSGHIIGILGSVIEEKGYLVAFVSDPLIQQRRIQAGNLVNQVAALAGGKGGGKPQLAQAGVKDIQMLEKALAGSEKILRELFQ